MRTAWICAGIVLGAVACSESSSSPNARHDAGVGGASGAGGTAGSGGTSTLPALTSTISDCGQASSPCATLDFAQGAHTISTMLFGDGVEWQNWGNGILARDSSGTSGGTLRPEVMSALGGVGFTLMRYPGGTLADLFHWKDSVGPLSARKPQNTLDLDSTGTLIQQIPSFGPDEFVSFANVLGCGILLTVNVGTGTAQEAADWIQYWKDQGVRPDYVEIGNEMYLQSPGGTLFSAMDPVVYAQKFDEYALAIHAVDPTLKLGVIGTLETSFWCYPNCTTHPWNEVVLRNIQQKADFFAIHNAYAPGTDQDSQAAYEAMLSYPAFIHTDDDYVEKDIDFHASAQNKGLPLAVTEHASFFLAPAGAGLDTVMASVGRNQTWAAALYSALSYQEWISDPRVEVANHINPLSWVWQAPIAIELPDFSTYPDGYVPNPRTSPFGEVFEAYRELAGQRFVPATVTGSASIDTQTIGMVPPLTGTPLVSAVGAQGIGASPPAAGWLFVINRSLTSDVDLSFVLKTPPAVNELAIDALGPSDYHDKTAAWTEVAHGTLPAPGKTFGMTVSLPHATLIRIRLL